MNISDHAYQGNSIYLQINLAGQDITDDIGGVQGLSKSLDYPRLTEYRVGEATITLNDPNGYYSPRNAANFFVANGEAQSGQGVACTIVTGFYTDSGIVSETLFTGEITKVTQGATGTTTVVVSDDMHTLFTEDITDFGVDRQFRLVAEDGRDIHGNYPIQAFVGPASKGSVTVKKDVNTDLTEVVALAGSGTFDSDNYVVTDTAVKTEGGTIEGAATGYPQITMKSPFRHRFLKDLVAAVATHLGLTTQDIYVPDITLGDNFSSEGRFGHELIATQAVGSSVAAEWGRYVTDYLYEAGDYYFLFNSRRGDFTTSVLVKYTESTYATSVVYESHVPMGNQNGAEFWRLAKNGDTIAILATDSNVRSATGTFPDYRDFVPTAVSYDARQANSETYIIFYDESTDMAAVRVPKAGPLKPQIACYYVFGETKFDTDPDTIQATEGLPAMLPDTRRGFQWYNNELYYAYCSATDTEEFGVAKVGLTGNPTSLFEIDSDGTNHAGINFTISGGFIWVGVPRRADSSSKVTVFNMTL